jgi:hypothetical protein
VSLVLLYINQSNHFLASLAPEVLETILVSEKEGPTTDAGNGTKYDLTTCLSSYMTVWEPELIQIFISHFLTPKTGVSYWIVIPIKYS